MKIGFISLGCAKNRVDTEIMMGLLKNDGHSIVNDTAQAEAVVINTCGFIESAKTEAIQTILDTARFKELNLLKHLIVTGCLSQRYALQLAQEMPEIDGMLGISSFMRITETVRRVMSGERVVEICPPAAHYIEQGPRILTTPAGTAYLKIAEGCGNRCSYCAIPAIRGGLRSRPLQDIVEEASRLTAEQKVRELVLVAQDLTSYGNELDDPKTDLYYLLEELQMLPGDFWIRLLYAYPGRISPQLTDLIAGSAKIVPYLDIPIQHASDQVLRRMNRRGDREQLLEMLDVLRRKIKNLVLRSTVMVGFPGETEDDYLTLLDFIRQAQFDWLGAFAYSPEESTPAAAYDMQVEDEIKAERLDGVMREQSAVTREKNISRIGSREKILVSSRLSAQLYIGRGYYQAPEVDGVTLVKSKHSLNKGDFIETVIEGVRGYDLIGREI